MKLSEDLNRFTLRQNGFYPRDNNYSKSVTVYSYKRKPLISMVITINIEEDYFTYTICDTNSGDLYFHYYVNQDIKNLVVRKVKTAVKRELKNLVKGGVLIDE